MANSNTNAKEKGKPICLFNVYKFAATKRSAKLTVFVPYV